VVCVAPIERKRGKVPLTSFPTVRGGRKEKKRSLTPFPRRRGRGREGCVWKKVINRARNLERD